VVKAVGQVNKFQELQRARADLLAGPAAEVKWKTHVLETGQGGQEIEKLEDESNLVPSDARPAIVGELRK